MLNSICMRCDGYLQILDVVGLIFVDVFYQLIQLVAVSYDACLLESTFKQIHEPPDQT